MRKMKELFWCSLSALILFLMSSSIYIFNYIRNLWIIKAFYDCIPSNVLSHWSGIISLVMFLSWLICLGLYAYINDWKHTN